MPRGPAAPIIVEIHVSTAPVGDEVAAIRAAKRALARSVSSTSKASNIASLLAKWR